MIPYFTPLDITYESINAHLFPSESIHERAQGVGLYDGKDKDLAHDSGFLVLTSHRLIYIDHAAPHLNSCSLDLLDIRQTEYWAGFVLSSSPKITLRLGKQLDTVDTIPATDSRLNWVCRVCSFGNTADAPKCQLCGVTKAEVKTPASLSRASTPSLPSRPPSAADTRIPCSVCTYLNHPALTSCELCGSTLGGVQAAASRSATPSSTSSIAESYVKLSFRKGSEKIFYSALKRALLLKGWQTDIVQPVNNKARAGIDGLVQAIDLDAEAKQTEMQDALSDLTSLMAKAKDMIDLAQSLSARIPANDDVDVEAKKATSVINDSLVSLGLPAPAVTQDMAKNDQDYYDGLARELASILTGSSRQKPLLSDEPQAKGLLPLDEIWCTWNRIRGVSLVSPKDLHNACKLVPLYTWPAIHRRVFRSGLIVLHTSRYSDDVFGARTVNRFERSEGQGLSTLHLAQAELLSIALTQELLEQIEESSGLVLRDEQSKQGTKWFPNLILGASQT